jgi:hypothetical protein
MWKYLKAAFFYSPPLPGIGRVPWNILVLACLGILGFAQSAFWLLGAGLEVGYLFLLATNPRFQRLTHADDADAATAQTMQQTQKLVTRLKPESRGRHLKLAQTCGRIEMLYQENQLDQSTTRVNRDAMVQLAWSHLKLLVAYDTLQSPERAADENTLRSQIKALEAELMDTQMPSSLQSSKRATLDIMRKRMDMLGKRGQTLKEIESDLQRIEAQIDLAMENARLQGHGQQTITPDIEMASQLLQDGMYGESEAEIAQLDAQLQRMRPARVAG